MKEHLNALHTRLFISIEDLLMAAYFSEYLLKNKLHYYPFEKKGKVYHRQAAFTISLIVSYWRPFSGADGLPNIPGRLINFDKQEVILHERIRFLRNKVMAHSSGEVYKIKPYNMGSWSTSTISQPFFLLTNNELRMLSSMIEKLLTTLGKRQKELEVELGEWNFLPNE